MATLKATWIIHSGFILEYSDAGKAVKVAIDPFLQPVSDIKDKWLEKLSDIDLLLITHGHFDHIGDACEVLKKAPNATYVGIYEIYNHINQNCGVKNEGVGMNIGGTWTFKKDGLELPITMVHATHSSDIGAPTGFIVRFPGFPVYHPGDTGVFKDMELFGELYGVKLALLPIGSHFTMGIDEAIYATKLIKPKYVIPMHYNTFPVIEADPYEFKKRVEAETETQVIVLKPGESYTFQI